MQAQFFFREIIQFYSQLKYKRIPIGLIWIVILISFAIKQSVEPHNILDSSEYLIASKQLFAKNSIYSTYKPIDLLYFVHRRTPLYPLLIFLGGYTFILASFIQFISCIYIPFGINQFIKKFGIDLNPNTFAYFMFLISWPLFSYYGVMAIPEIISTALLVLLLNSTGHTVGLSLIFTALIALKPVFLVLFPVLLIYNFDIKSIWMWLLPIFFVMFWMNKSKSILGFSTYSTIAVTNPYDYNRKILLSKIYNNHQLDSIYQLELEQINTLNSPKTVSDFMSQKVIESIKTHPIKYAFLHIKGALVTLIDPGRYDAMVFWNWHKTAGFMGVNDGNLKSERRLGEWAYILFFALMNSLKLVFIFVGSYHAMFIRKIKVSYYLFALSLVYLSTIGPVGSARYLIPFYAVFAVFGGWGIAVFAEKFKLFLHEDTSFKR